MEGRKPQIPFCSSLGLNYSNVYDLEKRSITVEKFKQTGLKIEPKIFNVSYKFLTNETFEKGLISPLATKNPL